MQIREFTSVYKLIENHSFRSRLNPDRQATEILITIEE